MQWLLLHCYFLILEYIIMQRSDCMKWWFVFEWMGEWECGLNSALAKNSVASFECGALQSNCQKFESSLFVDEKKNAKMTMELSKDDTCLKMLRNSLIPLRCSWLSVLWTCKWWLMASPFNISHNFSFFISLTSMHATTFFSHILQQKERKKTF